MTMVTRCPECSTAFKVTTEQLQARDGAVRCGRCQRVFNAFDALTTWPDSALAPATELGEARSAAAAGETPAAEGADVSAPVAEAKDAAEAVSAAEPLAIAPAQPELIAHPAQGGAEDGASRAGEPPELEWEIEDAPRSRRARLGWAAAVALAAVALAGQAVYFYRTELATLLPAARPLLEGACAVAGCAVPLPARAEYIIIEASDLKVDAERPSRLLLTVALRNRAPFPQRYPALELTLTGPQNQPLARRVFLPEDYVARDRPLAAGLAPNAVADALLPLDTGELAPAGYRLYSFYP